MPKEPRQFAAGMKPIDIGILLETPEEIETIKTLCTSGVVFPKPGVVINLKIVAEFYKHVRESIDNEMSKRGLRTGL